MQKFKGAILILICVFGGYIWAGGNLIAIWQPAELLIIAGATVGSIIIGNPPHVIKKMKYQFKRIVSNKKDEKQYYKELLSYLKTLLEIFRNDGYKAIESDVEHPDASELLNQYPTLKKDKEIITFISDNLRLISLGNLSPHDLDALLEQEIMTIEEDLLLPSKSMQRTAEALPGFGILAAVMGIIITMQSIDGSIALIGYHVAAALVGTFLGIFGCYCVLDPASNAMAQMVKRDLSAYECIRSVLVSHQSRKTPLTSIDSGRKQIQLDIKPSFSQMESWFKKRDRQES